MYSKKNNRKEKIDYLMFKPLNENRISNIKRGGTFKHIHVHLVITDTLNSQMSKSKKEINVPILILNLDNVIDQTINNIKKNLLCSVFADLIFFKHQKH